MFWVTERALDTILALAEWAVVQSESKRVQVVMAPQSVE